MVLNTRNCVYCFGLRNTDFGPGGQNKRTKSYSCRRNERKGKSPFHFGCLMQVLEFENFNLKNKSVEGMLALDFM